MTIIKHLFLIIPLGILLTGCSSTPVQPSQDRSSSRGQVIVNAAIDMLGTPYRYGGYSSSGVDCSGLVYLAHRHAGIMVPRTTRGQIKAITPIPQDQIRPGDLLFFRLNSRQVSHVGIYAGNGKFIHAPSTGKQVSYAYLSNRFWASRLVTAGRLYQEY